MAEAPTINIPESDSCCRLSIINTTCDICVPPFLLVQPEMEGKKFLNLPDYSFYIKNDRTGKELLFDLGSRKDWENYVPHIRDVISGIPGWKVERNVLDILPEGNVDVNNIEAFVLSHWHFDHTGNPAALPKSVKMVVGPGFKEAFLPGWPAKEGSPFHEADFEGREVHEIEFGGLKIGNFDAYDYFGDGSFYIINAPGHTTGHISALVRTTPDTFVFLGGDICHFTGMIRPSQYMPLPDEVPSETALDKRILMPCPCSAFLAGHRDQQNPRTTPFFTVSEHEHSFYDTPEVARQSISTLIEFDANPAVLVAIAHDPTSLDVFDFFPATMNDWKQKNWKKEAHWGFLSELPYNGKVVRPPIVDGLYDGSGKKVKDHNLAS